MLQSKMSGYFFGTQCRYPLNVHLENTDKRHDIQKANTVKCIRNPGLGLKAEVFLLLFAKKI